MGQSSNRSLIRLTSGRLGWRMERLYKKKALIKKGAENLKVRREKGKKIVFIYTWVVIRTPNPQT